MGSVLELRDGNGGVIDQVSSGNLPAPLALTDNYSYVRRLDGAGGAPLDTDATTMFRLIVKNTGNVQDTLRLSGRGDTPGWKVRYFDAPTGGNDISAAVKGNTYLVSVANRSSRELRIEVTPDASVSQGQTKDVPVSVRSESDGLYSDQATARVVQNGAQPTPAPVAFSVDASIRLASAQAYGGVGVVSPQTPDAAQTVSATASSGTPAVYNWRVQNKSSASDSFKLTLPATPVGWTVRLFTTLDSSTDEIDITAAAQSGAGYLTTSLAPDAFFEMRLEVKPDANTSGTITTNLSAASVGDTGGIDNALHKVTLMLNATQGGAALPNTTFQLSFENNVGHNYGTDTNPDIRRRTKIFDPGDPNNPWKETLTVTTNAQGQVPVMVLSSDVISQPRLIARWTDGGGQVVTVGGVKLDFAAAVSKRGFPDPVTGAYTNWENDDTGWTCNFSALEKPGDTIQGSVYLKFADGSGALQPLSGHTLRISLRSLTRTDETPIYDAEEASAYFKFLDSVGTQQNSVVATTDANGKATFSLKANEGVTFISQVNLRASNQTQWVK